MDMNLKLTLIRQWSLDVLQGFRGVRWRPVFRVALLHRRQNKELGRRVCVDYESIIVLTLKNAG